MEPMVLGAALERVREQAPLIHCITNYVTVNDCANALLACGASPIMSDEPLDVEDITALCNGLVLNIGTLNGRTIEAMDIAGRRAAQAAHPIVLDPVGAGASQLRTETASQLADSLAISVIRGNMSEIKALAGTSAKTRGVDASFEDRITPDTVAQSAAFARSLAARSDTVIAITGAIDIIADADRAYAIANGSPLMGSITGAGCMLSCLCAAYAAVGSDRPLDAVVAAVSAFGLAGQRAQERMGPQDGTGSFRTYLLDALSTMTGKVLEDRARIEEIR